MLLGTRHKNNLISTEFNMCHKRPSKSHFLYSSLKTQLIENNFYSFTKTAYFLKVDLLKIVLKQLNKQFY